MSTFDPCAPVVVNPGRTLLWSSDAVWKTNPRTINNVNSDPNDPKFARVHDCILVISGNSAGTATIRTPGADGSARFYIGVPNRNTEIIIFVNADPSLNNFNINHRNDHVPTCGFGGYHIGFEFADDRTEIAKEIVHAEYSSKENVPISPPLEYGQKYGFKTRCVDVAGQPNKIKLEAYLDRTGTGSSFTKLAEFIEGPGSTTQGGGTFRGLDWNSPDVQACTSSPFLQGKNATNFNAPVMQEMPYVWFRFNATSPADGGDDIVENVVISGLEIWQIPAEI